MTTFPTRRRVCPRTVCRNILCTLLRSPRPPCTPGWCRKCRGGLTSSIRSCLPRSCRDRCSLHLCGTRRSRPQIREEGRNAWESSPGRSRNPLRTPRRSCTPGWRRRCRGGLTGSIHSCLPRSYRDRRSLHLCGTRQSRPRVREEGRSAWACSPGRSRSPLRTLRRSCTRPRRNSLPSGPGLGGIWRGNSSTVVSSKES